MFIPLVIAAGTAAVIGAALAAGGTLGATALTNRAQKKANEEAYNRQRSDALADREHEEMYNSAANQVARAKAAGLAPAEYSNAFESSTRQTDYQAPQLQSPDIGAVLSNGATSFVNSSLREKEVGIQKDLASAQSEYLAAQSREASARAKFLEDTEEDRKSRLKLENTLIGQNISNEKQRLNNLISEGKVTERQASIIQKEIEWYDRIQESVVALNTGNVEYLKKLGFLADAHVNNLDWQNYKIRADVDLTNITIGEKEYNLNHIMPAMESYYKALGSKEEKGALYMGFLASQEEVKAYLSGKQFEIYQQNEEKLLKKLQNDFNCSATDAHTLAQAATLKMVMQYLGLSGPSHEFVMDIIGSLGKIGIAGVGMKGLGAGLSAPRPSGAFQPTVPYN